MKNILKYCFYYLYHYRWLNLIIIVTSTAFVSNGLITALNARNDVSIWFKKNDPVLEEYNQFNKEFDNDRIIVVNYFNSDGLFNVDILNKIKRTTDKIESINGVQKVWSFHNMKDFYRVDSAGVVRIKYQAYFQDSISCDAYEINEIKEKILRSPLLLNRLINTEGNSCLLLIHFNPFINVTHASNEILDSIKNIAYENLGKDHVSVGGLDNITYGLNKLSKHDFTLFILVNYALMLIVIILLYNRLIYLLIAFLTTFCSIISTISIYGIMGFRLNIFTIIIPSLIIILGLMLVLHVINEYEANNRKFQNVKNEKVVYLALSKVFQPCFFASITTIIGFLSLITSPTSVIKEFGTFSALGILMTFIFGFTFSAIFLNMIKSPKSDNKYSDLYTLILVRLNKNVFRYRYAYLISLGIIIICSVILSRNIKIDMYPLGYFPPNNEVLRDHEKIIKNWGEYFTIDLVLEVDSSTTIFNQEIIKSLQGFVDEIMDHEYVVNVYCYLDIMNRFSKVLYRKSLDEIFKSPHLVKQYTRFLKKNYAQETSINYVNKNLRKARITLVGPSVSTYELNKGISKIMSIASNHFNDQGKVKVVGFPSLFIRIMDYAFLSIRNSVILAIFLIFATMALWLRDIKMAFIAILPNVFPVLTMLGMISLLKINLDLATATIAAIIIGIAIDNTIHFLTRYKAFRKNKLSVEESIKETYLLVGRIILISSILLFIGFIVFIFASLKTVIYFGLLIAFSIPFTLMGDLILLPLCIKFLKKD